MSGLVIVNIFVATQVDLQYWNDCVFDCCGISVKVLNVCLNKMQKWISIEFVVIRILPVYFSFISCIICSKVVSQVQNPVYSVWCLLIVVIVTPVTQLFPRQQIPVASVLMVCAFNIYVCRSVCL